MYSVSDSYKEQIRKNIRNVSYIKIKFGIVDPDALQDASITGYSPMMPYAVIPELIDLYEVSRLYSTLETNFWLLDGSMNILPDSKTGDYQAYVSSQPSSSSATGSCEYTSGIQFTVGFKGNQYQFKGLSFVFDTIQGNYPTELTITCFLNGEQVYSTTTEVNAVEFFFEDNMPLTDSIQMTFTKNKLPDRRLRLQDITLGITRVISSETLTSATWTRSNDQMNTVLPANELSFSFYDVINEYNPDNPEGVWEYLETGQSVTTKFGYELDDGSIEWMPSSTLYITGTPTVDNSGALANVTFTANSRLQSLTDTYKDDVYRPSGATLYALADTLLTWSGLVDSNGTKRYRLSDKLKNYTFTGVLEAQEVRQIIQLIANAGMCLVDVDRSGVIVFKDRPTDYSEFNYTSSDIMTAMPSINKYPYLKTLSVVVNNYSVNSESTSLTSMDIVDANNTEYTFEYSAATNITVTATEGLTIDEIVNTYAQRATVKVTGTGTIDISGNSIETSTYTVSKTFNTMGEDCELTNALICNKEQALEYLDWMAEILQMRNTYTFDDRGFPEIDESDIVGVDTMYTEAKQGIITKSVIEYNGALSGSTEVLS